MSKNFKLTKNQLLVLNTLRASDKPKTAYDLLDQLRDRGIKAPAQIYRALTRLAELHLIHRIESINSYLSCQYPNHSHPQLTCLAICGVCQRVSELSETSMNDYIGVLTRKTGFTSQSAILEVHGTCSECEIS